MVFLVTLVNTGLCIDRLGATERDRPIRIGALSASWGPTPYVVGLRDGLQELGYHEGEHFVLGIRFTQGDLTALPAAARQLVEYKVDLIITDSDDAARAAQMAATQTPIVFAGVADPLGLGLIETFAKPGGNITGVTDLEFQLGPKRLEIFQDVVPRLKRVLLPYDAKHGHAVAAARIFREAARRLGIELLEKPVGSEEEAEASLAQIRKGQVDGILISTGSPSLNIPGIILQVSTQQAIPTMFQGSFWVERGGLASYGPNAYRTGQQAARLADKILKGAHPSEIPVETNSQIEFVINLQVAKAMGLTIAPEVLYRADRLIR